MRQRVQELSSDQLAEAAASVEHWTRAATCTDEADWARFHAGVEAAYRASWRSWPGRVVRVSSPVVGALAAPLADRLLTRRHRRPLTSASVDRFVRGTLRRSRVNHEAQRAIATAVREAVGLEPPGVPGRSQGVVIDPVVDEMQESVSRFLGIAAGAGAVLGIGGGIALTKLQLDFPLGWAIVLGLLAGSVIGAFLVAILTGIGAGIVGAVRGEPEYEIGRLSVRLIRPPHWFGQFDERAQRQIQARVGDPLEALCEGINAAVHEAVDSAVVGAVGVGWVDRARPEGRYVAGQWATAERGRAAFVERISAAPEALGDWTAEHAMRRATASAGWWWPHREFVMVCDRPRVLRLDPDGTPRLHSDDGPAVVWPDGWTLYFVHGVRVTRQIVEEPETLVLDQITREENAEVRRVMIDRYGTERYLREAKARQLHSDDFGTLWRLRGGHEVLQFVQVVNSTPEPDGTFRDYWLRVPPTVQTAHEAVAWTFGLTPEEYRPERQT